MTCPRPYVFKICGAWVWRCQHSGGRVGNEFFEYDWESPWVVCYSDAVRHAALYHNKPAEATP